MYKLEKGILFRKMILMFSLEDGLNPNNSGGLFMIFLDTGYFRGLMDDNDPHHIFSS